MLSDFGLGEDRVIRVVVHVDEAGRDRQPCRIDPPRSRRGLEIADGRDAPAADPDVRSNGGSALPVEHRAAGDQQVVGLLRRRTRAGGGEEEKCQEGNVEVTRMTG